VTRERWADRTIWVLAIALAVVGVVATVWRPVAPSLPSMPVPQEAFDDGILAAVRSYRVPRLVGATALLLLNVALPVLLVLWGRSRRWLVRRCGDKAHAPVRGGLVGAVIVVIIALVEAPLLFWLGHVHPGQWGFRTASAVGWARDFVAALLIEAVVAGVAVAALLVVVARARRSWPAWAAVLGTVLTAVVVVLQPLVVEPLFLPTTSMPAGPMRDRLQEVLASAGVEADLLVGAASQRTTNVNAYVAGLGPTRRVVVYDTLLDLPRDAVAAVVAHELAHREHEDVLRGVIGTSAALLPAAMLLAWWLRRPRLVALVGARSPADPRLVPVLVAGVAVLTLAGLPLANTWSRRAEAAADARALELTRDPSALIETFRIFVVSDLSWPDPPGVRTVLFGTHPPANERIRAVVGQAQRAGLDVPPVAVFQEQEVARRHLRAAASTPGTP